MPYTVTPAIELADVATIEGTITTRDGRTVPFTIDPGAGTVSTRQSAWDVANLLADGLIAEYDGAQ